MYRNHSVTVLIPCLNEEAGIGEVISSIPKFVDEIIAIDNGSEDRTAEIAMNHGALVIDYKFQKGYGGALMAGFKRASGDIIITADGDNTYPLNYVDRIIDKLLDSDTDFISCNRFPLMERRSMRFINRIGNYFLVFLINILFSLRIKDALSGMLIFKKHILNKISLESSDYCLSVEIKIKTFQRLGAKAIEIPISYKTRIGSSKLKPWGDGIKIIKFIIKLRFSEIKI